MYWSIYIPVSGGHTEVVRMLIEAGADVNVKQSGYVTPLHLAAKGKDRDMYNIKALTH